MATVGQIYYNVIDNNSGSYIKSGEDIYRYCESDRGFTI